MIVWFRHTNTLAHFFQPCLEAVHRVIVSLDGRRRSLGSLKSLFSCTVWGILYVSYSLFANTLFEGVPTTLSQTWWSLFWMFGSLSVIWTNMWLLRQSWHCLKCPYDDDLTVTISSGKAEPGLGDLDPFHEIGHWFWMHYGSLLVFQFMISSSSSSNLGKTISSWNCNEHYNVFVNLWIIFSMNRSD